MLTAVVLTRNSEADLKQLLPQLNFADKLLIIDDESTDGTLKYAKRFGARILRRKLKNDFAAQRNFGLSKSDNGWVLFVDPDERVSDALAEEIKQAIRDEQAHDGYFIPRRDVFIGKQLKFGETAQTELVRLGKKNAGKWRRPVHEVWEIKRAGHLQQPLVHHAHANLSHFWAKIKRYASIEAQFRTEQAGHWSLAEQTLFPPGKFLYTYLWLGGWLDGWPGLMMSVGMSYHSWLVRANQFKLELGRLLSKSFFDKWYWRLNVVIWLLLLWGQLTRLDFPPWISVYLFELLMVLQVSLWLGIKLKRDRKVSLPPGAEIWSLMTLSLGMSLLVNWEKLGDDWWRAGLYWGRWWLYSLYGFGVFDMSRPPGIRRLIRQTLLALGSWLSFGGLIQYFVMPDMRWIFFYGWDDHYFRAVGTLLDPGFLSLTAVLTLILFYFWRPRWWQWGAGLSLACLLLTYARSGYVVFILCLMVWGWQKRQRLKAAAMLGLFLVAVVWLPRPGGEGVKLERSYSVQSRAESMATAWNLFVTQPVWGIGFNSYRTRAGLMPANEHLIVHPSGPDNSWLLLLVTGGVIGFGMSLLFYGRLWRWASGDDAAAYSLLALYGHSLTNNSLFYPWLMIWMWLIIAGAELKEQRDRPAKLKRIV